MSKGFDIPHNKHLGNSHDYWKAPQDSSKKKVVWDMTDRKSRIKAFDKLIEIYSK